MAAASSATMAPASGSDPKCCRFTGKVVLVTGAAGDIGKAIAERLASEGASLLLIDIRKEPLDAVASKIKALAGPKGGDVQTCVADVTDKAAVALYVAQGEAMGGIDGFFNNAGIQGRFIRTDLYDEDEFAKILSVNLFGAFNGLKQVSASMVKAGKGGSIVNTASLAGVTGPANMLAYSASKFGVVGLTKTAARDLAQFGIRVNALSPDLIESGMWPTQLKGQIVARAEGDESAATEEAMAAQEAAMKAGVAMDRLGTTAELAGVVSFLLSDDASYVTGKNMEVDGGRL